MAEAGAFERALADTEGVADSALKAASSVSRELKRVKKGAAAGQPRELRKAADSAAALARALAETAAGLSRDFDFDEVAYLASGDYLKELLTAADDAGVAMYEEDGQLLCYPSLVRIFAGDAALEIDRRRERRLRPSVVLDALAAKQRRPARFKAEPFLDSVRSAYELVIARDGKKEDAVVRVTDIWSVLTLLPGQSRDYTKQEFARDLYQLDRSGVTQTAKSARPLRWAASTGTKGAGVLTTVAESGQRQKYWGIAFNLAEADR